MQAELAVDLRRPAGGFPGLVVAGRTTRKAVRSGVIWGYVFGIAVASSALGYVAAYKTDEQRSRFAAIFGPNVGLAAINGPARDLQTVAGYTVWKIFMFTAIIGGVWGLLTATRLMRGEEDAGRWELLLAGQTTRRRAAAQALAGLGAGLVALWIVTAVVTAFIGRSSKVGIGTGPALYFAVALVASPAIFLAAGALASQLAPTRRQAAAYAGTALGVAYALRLVADSGTGLSWLRWVSPLGWVEELQPLTTPRPLVLLPIAALTVGMAVLAVALAGSRDIGASVLPDRATSRPRTRLLNGHLALDLRLARPVLLGWAVALGLAALLLGTIAKQGGSILTSSTTVENVVSRLGARGSSAEAYLGIVSLLLAVMLTFVASGQVSAARAEEADGRVEHLLVRPVARASWFGGRVLLAAVALMAGGLIAGLLTWAGAISQGADVHFGHLLEAGLNLVPPSLCVLGAGMLAMGLRPRAASIAAYGLIAWSFLIEFVGGALNSEHWLLDTSVFHQMAAAPAVSPDWTSAAVMSALGLGAAALGGWAFGRRDLAGD